MDIVYTFTRFDETLNIEIGKTHPKFGRLGTSR